MASLAFIVNRFTKVVGSINHQRALMLRAFLYCLGAVEAVFPKLARLARLGRIMHYALAAEGKLA